MALTFEGLIVVVGLAVIGTVHFVAWVIEQICDTYDRICKRVKRSFWKRR
jgi:hypothetical protein